MPSEPFFLRAQRNNGWLGRPKFSARAKKYAAEEKLHFRHGTSGLAPKYRHFSATKPGDRLSGSFRRRQGFLERAETTRGAARAAQIQRRRQARHEVPPSEVARGPERFPF